MTRREETATKHARIWQLLAEDPALSLRALAAEAGCSATFAGEVRAQFEFVAAPDWEAAAWARQAARDERLAVAATEIVAALAKAHAERGREVRLGEEFA